MSPSAEATPPGDPVSVVTYFDFGPSLAGKLPHGLRPWATLLRSQGGAAEAMLLQEINRPNRFALVETWTDAALWTARQAKGVRLETSVAADLSAPPDERIGEVFCTGTARPAGPSALCVLVHIDVVPFNLTVAGDWLRVEADAARSAPGALRYDIWRQVDRPNHFTSFQIWVDHAAYAQHVESAPTRSFRANLLSMKGALYDERLYQRVD